MNSKFKIFGVAVASLIAGSSAFAVDYYYYGNTAGAGYAIGAYYLNQTDGVGGTPASTAMTAANADLYFSYITGAKKQMYLLGTWGVTLKSLQNTGSALPVDGIADNRSTDHRVPGLIINGYDILLQSNNYLTITQLTQNSVVAFAMRKNQGGATDSGFTLTVGTFDIFKGEMRVGSTSSQHMKLFSVTGKTTLDASNAGTTRPVVKIYGDTINFQDTVTFKGASVVTGTTVNGTPTMYLLSGTTVNGGAGTPAAQSVITFKDIDFQSGWIMNIGTASGETGDTSIRMVKSVTAANVRQTAQTSGVAGTWTSYVEDFATITGALSTVGNHSATFNFRGTAAANINLNTVDMQSAANQTLNFGEAGALVNAVTLNGTASWSNNNNSFITSYAKTFTAKDTISTAGTGTNAFSFYGDATSTVSLQSVSLNNTGAKTLAVGTAAARLKSFIAASYALDVYNVSNNYVASVYADSFTLTNFALNFKNAGTHIDSVQNGHSFFNLYGALNFEIGTLGTAIGSLNYNRINFANQGNTGSLKIGTANVGKGTWYVFGDVTNYFKSIDVTSVNFSDGVGGKLYLRALDSTHVGTVSATAGKLDSDNRFVNNLMFSVNGISAQNISVDQINVASAALNVSANYAGSVINVGRVDLTAIDSTVRFTDFGTAYRPVIATMAVSNNGTGTASVRSDTANVGNGLAIGNLIVNGAVRFDEGTTAASGTVSIYAGKITGGKGNNMNRITSNASATSDTMFVINGTEAGKNIFSGRVHDVSQGANAADIAGYNTTGGGKIGITMDAADGVSQYFIGANYYRGDTVIKGGNLFITSNNQSQIQSTGMALGRILLQGGGFGATGAAVNEAENPTFSEIGSVRATDMLWSGGSLLVDISGENYDKVLLSGNLIKDSSADKFKVVFNIDGYADGFDYNFIQLTGEDSSITGFTAADFEAELVGAVVPEGMEAKFFISADGKTLGFRIAAIPEPSTCAALFGLFALALVALRRRNSKK